MPLNKNKLPLLHRHLQSFSLFQFKNFLLIALLASCVSVVKAQTYAEGTHYDTLSKAQPVSTGDKVEVRELFWYGCPHCFTFEPYIQRWQESMPDNTQYVAMPALFRKDWEFHARAYYTFEALGMIDKLHEPFFEAIHKDQTHFHEIGELVKFTDKHGVDSDLVKDTFDSFAVETKIRQGKAALPGYEATGVPAIIIDGKYRSSVQQAGGEEELLKVINFLVDKAASER